MKYQKNYLYKDYKFVEKFDENKYGKDKNYGLYYCYVM